MSLKFGSVRSVADALVPWMQQAAAGELTAAGTRSAGAAITWVPLSPGRRRERGFDQAEALARGLSGRSRIPAKGLLERARETPPQARRSADERRSAIRGAFRVVEDPPPTTILVDDVLTTGATADACARALRDAGSSAVGLVTAARSLAGALPARCYTRDVWILS